jgi:SPP1 gp7 family putative phage head morphogenesis protein
METLNERLRDADISHQVDLQRYANHVVKRIIALLNRIDLDLFAQITVALEKMPPDAFNVERLDQLLYSVRQLNVQAYRQVEQELTAELKDFAQYEAGYQHKLFASHIPPQIIAQVDVATVNVEQVYAAAMARPFQGRLLKEWASQIEAGRMTRIRDAIRMGYVENQSIGEIVQRIRGTRAKGYSDGIIEIDRRNAEAVARTAVSHVAAVTRDRFLKANGDLIKAVVWTATLDSRTSEGCRLRDGLKYTADDAHKPIGHNVPWLGGPGALHWNCRSTSVPVVKSWKDLGGVDIGEFSPSTRASMDGQVPADTTYADWLQKQSAARQDDILGPTRGKLMRDGGLTLDRFYNDKGRYLTLEELQQRDAEAFKRAGL